MLSKKEYRFFSGIVILSFFAFGLFPEYMACIFCGILGLFFLYLSVTKEKIRFYRNAESLSIITIVICYLLAALRVPPGQLVEQIIGVALQKRISEGNHLEPSQFAVQFLHQGLIDVTANVPV